jgi:predicted DNA-binding transcriptional regulator AlpA
MPLVDTEDLIDAVEVARLLGLAQRNSVSTYLRIYPDMPRAVIDLGPSRPRLWLRSDINAWILRRGPVRRGRPAKGSTASSDNNRPPSGGTGVSKGGTKPQLTSKAPPRPRHTK